MTTDDSALPRGSPLLVGLPAWMERATALRRWAAQWATGTPAATDLLVEAAHIGAGQHVLDLAAGPGDPALRLAAVVGPTGHVTAIDAVPEMLAIAREAAARYGLATMSFIVAPAVTLPLADDRLDAVICRFSLAQLPDPARALREAHRVLKPGGHAAVAVWGPRERNPFVAALDNAFALYLPPMPFRASALSPFAFATAGTLSMALRAAGFAAVREGAYPIDLAPAGSPCPRPPGWQGEESFAVAAEEVAALRAHRPSLAGAPLESFYPHAAGARPHLPAIVIVGVGTKV